VIVVLLPFDVVVISNPQGFHFLAVKTTFPVVIAVLVIGIFFVSLERIKNMLTVCSLGVCSVVLASL